MIDNFHQWLKLVSNLFSTSHRFDLVASPLGLSAAAAMAWFADFVKEDE